MKERLSSFAETVIIVKEKRIVYQKTIRFLFVEIKQAVCQKSA